MPVPCAGQPRFERRTMCGAVRMASRTRDAPPSVRSTAISEPVLPAPTTSTSLPRYGAAFRYVEACTSSPGKFSTPGHAGGTGVWLYPVATTTVVAVNDSPASVSTTQLP